MIKYMTPSRIELIVDGREVLIPGEALVRMAGQPDFVVYAASIAGWQPPYNNEPLSYKDKLAILETVRADLSAKEIAFEIEDEAQFLGDQVPPRCAAGDVAPRRGYWFTPAKQGSCQYFKEGDLFPEIEGSSYGATFWQWSPDQSAPSL